MSSDQLVKYWESWVKKYPIVSIEDGIDKCHEFMENAKQTLDKAVYGLNDAKLQIMQMVGQWIVNPSAIGTAIAIKGPPGTGKTTLVKDGISKILNRDFAFIALGGATDSCFLEGHSYTYEGSTWGKIVDILIKCKSMNPVIYFDELDKIRETPRGEEIAGILTHLTDTSQNSQFHDKYFADIDFDLSKCLFIFSYNDESKVNPILKDRMYRIETKGYNYKQKINIANNYLLPKIREQVKFSNEDIIIPEKFRWVPIRTRYDKTESVLRYGRKYGNNAEIAFKIWRSIQNPVLMSDFNDLAKGNIPDKNKFYYDNKIDGFMVIDLDKFKPINDNYGHNIGDEVLKKTAEFLKKEFRQTDTIYRYGGEEFIIIMKDVDVEEIKRIKNKLGFLLELDTTTTDGDILKIKKVLHLVVVL